jgi:hypothetical protein
VVGQDHAGITGFIISQSQFLGSTAGAVAALGAMAMGFVKIHREASLEVFIYYTGEEHGLQVAV